MSDVIGSSRLCSQFATASLRQNGSATSPALLRMPVILPEQHHAAWLGETDDGNLKALLLPYPADEMRMWEISPRVNSPKNDDPSLWEPIHAQPTQTTTDALELLRE